MHLFLTIFAFIVIFSLLILIHEAGHFFAAKRAGVKVEEFGFGMPPRLFGVKRGDTVYSVNWIPFGGFVRLLGQDDSSKEAKSSQRSYSNKPLRVQAWIVCAGVVMNLLLAFVLLTVGFWVGIEPLIATEDDFLEGIRDGFVHVEAGIVVVDTTYPYNTVAYGATDLQVRPFESGDRLLGFDTTTAWQSLVDELENGGEAPLISVNRADGSGGAEYLTKDLLHQSTFAPLYLPRLVYRDTEDSIFHGILETGDVLLTVGTSAPMQSGELLTVDDLEKSLSSFAADFGGAFVFQIYRPSFGELSVQVQLPTQYPLISSVEEGSPAEQLGLEAGDEIQSVNGVFVHTAAQVVTAVHCPDGSCASAGATADFVIQKAGATETTFLTVPLREDGRVGIGLADPIPYYGNLSVYPSYVLHTLMGTDTVRYGWDAPLVAIQEMWRLGKMTAVMFVSVLKQFVTAQGVPDGVSGPVGIAQMTGVTLQQGWAALLRFVALLSLSLGVINILPFPALDGGHFALILFKGITGKKDNPKWERVINLGGFLFLISFILFITFNDVMNLF